jgi:transcription initiation factor TFIIB
MCAAVVYVTCRKEGYPVTRSRVVREADVAPSDFDRCIKALVVFFQIRVDQVVPEAFLARSCAELGLSFVVERRARALVALWRQFINPSGKNLLGVVAAALYVAALRSGAIVGQHEVATLFDLTEVTLRTRKVEIERLLGQRRKLMARGTSTIASSGALPV